MKIGDKVTKDNEEFVEKTGDVGRVDYFDTGKDSNGNPAYKKREVRSDKVERLDKEREKIQALEDFKRSDELRENIEKGHKMRHENLAKKFDWMYRNFKTNGEFDIKKRNPNLEHAGNFNYGAVGTAAGLSELELKLGGGVYQIWSRTSSRSFL